MQTPLLKENKMANKVIVQNPTNGLTKTGYYGFSWTYLFFGWLVPLFRGELGVAALHMLFTVCTLGIWQIVVSFLYNKQYMIRLLEKGYVLKDTEQTMAAARANLGIAQLEAASSTPILAGNEQTPISAEPALKKSNSKIYLLIVGALFLAMVVVAVFNSNDKSSGINNGPLEKLENATASDIQPSGELAALYEIGGNATDIQRDNKTSEIKGKIIDWTLEVYEVSKSGSDYIIQTSGDNLVGTFTTLTTRNNDEKIFVESLKTGDLIRVKGVIDGVTLRSIELNPVILYSEKKSPAIALKSNTSEAAVATPDAEVVNTVETMAQATVANSATEPLVIADKPVAAENENTIPTPSFDCTKAETKVEKLICSNLELAELDAHVSRAYKQETAPSRDADYVETTKKAQKEWLKERNTCETTECLKQKLLSRYESLAPWDFEQHD